MPTPDIIEFVTDPELLGLSISPYQETLLKAIQGDLLSRSQHAIFRECTGRTSYPAQPFSEVTVVAGARSGKDSRVAAPIVCYEALYGGHEHRVQKGERAIIPLVAQDARAADVAFGYVKDYFTKSPLLAARVADVLTGKLVLTNGITVACFPCTLKSLRGYSIPVAVMDELGFYRTETGSADSDQEIQTSLRRGMVGFTSGTKLVKISTPYMKSGVLFDDFQRAFGKPDLDLLVWKASTLQMNPTITAQRLERERRLDPVRFAREYLADFAEDIEAFLPGAWVEQAVAPNRHELPPNPGAFRYVAACDPNGGGQCAFALSIVHVEGKDADRRIVQDVMRSWNKTKTATADHDAIVKEIAAVCARYNVAKIFGDRYASSWVPERFRAHGLRYENPEVKAAGADEPTYLDKSRAYLEVDPLFAQARIDILDHPQLIRELKLLERRPQAGGKIRVDRPRGVMDDHANALALSVAMAARSGPRPFAGAAGNIPPGITCIGSPGSGAIGEAIRPAAGTPGNGQAGYVERGQVGGQAAQLDRPFGRWGRW